MSYPPTTTKGSGDSTPVTTFEIDAPNIPITHTGTKASLGTVAVAGGGTGAVTLTAHGVVVGNGTSAVNITTAGTATHVLTSNGASADPTFQIAPTAATGNYAVSTQIGAYTNSSASWSDMAIVSGSNTLTSVTANGITLTAAGSNLPGITWTPPAATSVYQVSVLVSAIRNTIVTDDSSLRLYDGTTAWGYTFIQLGTGSVLQTTIPSCIVAPNTTSAYTLKLQAFTDLGTTRIEDFSGHVGFCLQWSIIQIVP